MRDSPALLFTNPFLVDLARLIAEDKSAEIATWNPGEDLTHSVPFQPASLPAKPRHPSSINFFNAGKGG